MNPNRSADWVRSCHYVGREAAYLGCLALLVAALWTYAWADAAWSAAMANRRPPLPIEIKMPAAHP